VPLLSLWDLVTTFNVLYLAAVFTAACAMYLLALDVVGRRAEAWLAGAIFAWSPTLVARSEAHLSLVAAAPIPIFVWAVLRAGRTGARRMAALAGGALAWAYYSDPYYGVYCAAFAAWHLGTQAVAVERRTARTEGVRPWRPTRLDAAIAGLAAVVAVIGWSGGGRFRLLGSEISITGLHTPVLLLTLLLLARIWRVVRPSIRWRPTDEFRTLVHLAPLAVGTATVALAPVMLALLRRVMDGRYVSARIFWRSSTPGVDLASLVMPNPNHPLASPWFRDWLARQDGGFVENVAALTLTVPVLLALTLWRRPGRLPRYWLAFTATAASFALGPFVHFAGINTYVPTPWSLLRYVPVLGDARAPARFMVLVMLGLALLTGLALRAWGERHPSRRAGLLALTAFLIGVELWPIPRPLYAARTPAIYARIAADPRDVRVLELPFGIRDGLSSHGDFNASSQFYQASHGKPLIGGYLSRVSARRIEAARQRPVLAAMMRLSAGEPLSPAESQAARRRAPTFLANAELGYVVIDRSRATPELAAFAVELLRLDFVARDGTRDLYQTPATRAFYASGRLNGPADSGR